MGCADLKEFRITFSTFLKLSKVRVPTPVAIKAKKMGDTVFFHLLSLNMKSRERLTYLSLPGVGGLGFDHGKRQKILLGEGNKVRVICFVLSCFGY